jgi:hypothetical protein
MRAVTAVESIAALILHTSERFDVSVPVECHQSVAEPLELLVVRYLLEAVDDRIGPHQLSPAMSSRLMKSARMSTR